MPRPAETKTHCKGAADLVDWLALHEVTQADFARRIGMSGSQLHQLLTTHTPGIVILAMIEEETRGDVLAVSWARDAYAKCKLCDGNFRADRSNRRYCSERCRRTANARAYRAKPGRKAKEAAARRERYRKQKEASK